MTATETMIYSISYPSRIPEGFFQSLLERLPGAMAKKVTQYRRWEDAHGSLLGKFLLTFALAAARSPATLHDLQYSSFGRPYLDKGPDFNISHSGNRVACILGTKERVGIDLEEIRPLAIGDFREQFTDAEWAGINGAQDPLAVFYHYWTAKESIIKADGRGLNLPLGQLAIDQGRTIALADRNWMIRRIEDFQGYACHIATEGTSEALVKEISLSEIIAAL